MVCPLRPWFADPEDSASPEDCFLCPSQSRPLRIPRSYSRLGSYCLLVVNYNPDLLGEHSQEEAIIAETIIRGSSNVIPVEMLKVSFPIVDKLIRASRECFSCFLGLMPVFLILSKFSGLFGILGNYPILLWGS